MGTQITRIRVLTVLVMLSALGWTPSAEVVGPTIPLEKFEPALRSRISWLTGQSRVIVRASSSDALGSVVSLVRQLGGAAGPSLSIINSQVVTLPNVALALLSMSSDVRHISTDRLVVGAMERTGATVGATSAREDFGLDGSGV